MTFAQKAKAIEKKYASRKGDRMAEEAMDMELQALVQEQERVRAELGYAEPGEEIEGVSPGMGYQGGGPFEPRQWNIPAPSISPRKLWRGDRPDFRKSIKHYKREGTFDRREDMKYLRDVREQWREHKPGRKGIYTPFPSYYDTDEQDYEPERQDYEPDEQRYVPDEQRYGPYEYVPPEDVPPHWGPSPHFPPHYGPYDFGPYEYVPPAYEPEEYDLYEGSPYEGVSPETASAEFKKGGKWIQKVTKSIARRGTEGVCTGAKFGSASCPPGSRRYNLAKTFRAMAKRRKKQEGGYYEPEYVDYGLYNPYIEEYTPYEEELSTREVPLIERGKGGCIGCGGGARYQGGSYWDTPSRPYQYQPKAWNIDRYQTTMGTPDREFSAFDQLRLYRSPSVRDQADNIGYSPYEESRLTDTDEVSSDATSDLALRPGSRYAMTPSSYADSYMPPFDTEPLESRMDRLPPTPLTSPTRPEPDFIGREYPPSEEGESYDFPNYSLLDRKSPLFNRYNLFDPKDFDKEDRKKEPPSGEWESYLPIGLGLAASFLPYLHKLPPESDVRYPRLTPERITLEPGRTAARRSYDVARNIAQRNLAQAGVSKGQYLTGTLASGAALTGAEGALLGQSYQQETLANAQERARVDAANAQIEMQELERAQMEKDMRESYRQQRLQSTALMLQQAISDTAKTRAQYQWLGDMDVGGWRHFKGKVARLNAEGKMVSPDDGTIWNGYTWVKMSA